MPCRDGGYQDPRNEQIDRLTRLLCYASQELETAGHFDRKTKGLRGELRAWWQNHKRKDRVRREAEARNAKRHLQTLRGEMNALQSQMDEIREEIQEFESLAEDVPKS